MTPAWLAALRAPRSVGNASLWLAAWLTLAGNLALWSLLIAIPEFAGAKVVARALPFIVLGAILMLLHVALLSVSGGWRLWRPMAAVWIGIAACAQHFMLTYHVVMDPTMLTNVMQTDLKETRDLLGVRFFAVVLAMALPAWAWLACIRIERETWRRRLVTGGVWALATLFLMVAVGFAGFRQLAPLMRNHPELRYTLNPAAPIYSAGRSVFKRPQGFGGPLVAISGGAALGASYAAQAKPPLLVLVVGETARADHFSLDGYARDTNPELAQRDVLSWRDAHSCGTSTAASVPCMFSHLGKEGFEARKAEYETLLDVVQASGLAVLWIDNQAGCKGVCERVPHVQAECGQDECLDTAMLEGLDARIAALPAERRARGVLLVMHQMGSHGPAYSKRSAPYTKRFLPECTSIDLPRCGKEELVNAFDNSIVETDRFLARTIDWLHARDKDWQGAMLYMSDHGESLGEFGIYLHGMPYGFAPEAQKHVPLIFWPGGLAARGGLSAACLRARLGERATHDNLYPTVLGLLDVKSPTYQARLDLMAPCRGVGG